MVMALGLVAVMANVSAAERLYAIAKVMCEREAQAALDARRKANADPSSTHSTDEAHEAGSEPVEQGANAR
jgi:hypothetical protein